MKEIFYSTRWSKNHISCDDKIFNDVLVEKGINATLYTQAVNSPDVNLLDLAFFGAIQSFNDTAPKMKKN